MGLDTGYNTGSNISILMVHDHKMILSAFGSELTG